MQEVTQGCDPEESLRTLKELIPNAGNDIAWEIPMKDRAFVAVCIINKAKEIMGEEKTLELLQKKDEVIPAEDYPFLTAALCNYKDCVGPGQNMQKTLVYTVFNFGPAFQKIFLSTNWEGSGFQWLTSTRYPPPWALRKFFKKIAETRHGAIQESMESSGPTIFEVLKLSRAEYADIICEYALAEGGPDLLKRILVGSDNPDHFQLDPAFDCYSSEIRDWFEKIHIAGGKDLVVDCLRHDNYSLWKRDLKINFSCTDRIAEWLKEANAVGGQELVAELIDAATHVDCRVYAVDTQKLLLDQARRYGDFERLRQAWWPKSQP